MPSRTANTTTSAAKRKRRDSDAPKTHPTMDKDELSEYAEAYFPTFVASLTPASSMLFLRQIKDPKGGPARLLVGKMHRNGVSVSIFAYLKGPSWVVLTAGGPKIDRSTLSADPTVVLEEPFNFLDKSRHAGDIEALVFYYHVVRGHWKEYETDPDALVNLGVFKLACKRVHDEKKKMIEANASEEDVNFAAPWTNTLEEDVSSGLDSEDDSLFVKDCKQCRKLNREESRYRSEGHLEAFAAMQKEIHQLKEQHKKDVAYMKRQRNLVMQEANTLERENREYKENAEEVEEWKSIAQKAMKGQKIARALLLGKNVTDAKVARWRWEMDISDDEE